MGDERLEALGRRVRLLRLVHGLTHAQLAAKVGKSRPTISNLEAGRQNPPYILVMDVAAVLGTSMAVLAGEEDGTVVHQITEAKAEADQLEREAENARLRAREARRKVQVIANATEKVDRDE